MDESISTNVNLFLSPDRSKSGDDPSKINPFLQQIQQHKSTSLSQINNPLVTGFSTSTTENPFLKSETNSEDANPFQPRPQNESPFSLPTASTESLVKSELNNPFLQSVAARNFQTENPFRLPKASTESFVKSTADSLFLHSSLTTGNVGLSQASSETENPFLLAKTQSSIAQLPAADNPFLQSIKSTKTEAFAPFTDKSENPFLGKTQSVLFGQQAKLQENPFSKTSGTKESDNPFKVKQSITLKPIDARGKRDIKSRLGIRKVNPIEGVQKEKPFSPTPTGNTIHLHDIPAKYFAQEFLNSHYSQFGVIIKVELKPTPTRQAFVTFVDHTSANKAMNEGRIMETGADPIEITWHQKNFVPKKPTIQPQKRVRKRSLRQSLDDFKIVLKEFAMKLKTAHCPTSMEKYELLDKLDKKIREGIRRDPREYKVLVGTCNDMCPEKERYFRDDKCQSSQFEISSDQGSSFLDPLKAVKEYSRSSADQEVPLPHELRTITALKMTMNYLISNIMVEELSKISEWFDFLWNRTRAIRKDITQQNLKCLTSINIVEKCSRFHVFCSHNLCEEEMHVFDTKINLENLTKCLQTLKHMYEDIWNEKQVHCPNEAEFRGYQILLNLNDGDVLREIMNFSDVIRNSQHVKFALQVYRAVQENNYVRFFKLLKRASFLNACLMHPYFTQMRSIALKRMARAYATGKTDIPFSLEHLTNILAFNDLECAAQFCNHYGFATDDVHVYLNRASYTEPEDRYPRECSIIIEELCSQSMSEIVNGDVVIPNYNYKPVDSFTDSGYYNGSYHELTGVPDELEVDDDEETAETEVDENFDPTYQTVENDVGDDVEEIEEDDGEVNDDDVKDEDYVDSSRKQQPPKQTIEKSNDIEDGGDEIEKVMILREDVMKASTELVDELIEKVTNQVFTNMYNEWQQNLIQSNHFVENLIAVVSVEDMKEVAEKAMEEVSQEVKKEAGEILESNAKVIQNEVINVTTQSVLKDVCDTVYRENKAKQRTVVLERESVALQQYLISATILEMVNNIVFSVYKDTELEKKADLVKIKHGYQRARLEKYFKKWVKAYKSHVYVKSTLNHFPSHAPLLSTREAIKNLNIRETGEETERLQVCADVSWMDNERNFKLALQSYNEKFERKRKEILRPISMGTIFKKGLIDYKLPLPHHRNGALHWNLKVISPNNMATKFVHSKLTPYILVRKLSSESLDIDAMIEKGTEQRLSREIIKSKIGDVNVSVNYISGDEAAKNSLSSPSCIVYILDIPSQITNNFWSEENHRLSFYLSSSTYNTNPSLFTKFPSPSLIILAIGNTAKNSSDEISRHLGLVDFQKRKRVDQVNCFVFNDVITDVNEFQLHFDDAIQCAVRTSQFRLKTTSKQLSAFIEQGLSVLFFNFFHQYCLNCKTLDLLSPDPADVVCFYNNVVQEISNVLMLSTFQRNDDIDYAEEEDISFDEKLDILNQLVLNLKLPVLPDTDKDCFMTSYQTCLHYIDGIEHKESTALLNRINILLQDHNSNINDPESFTFPWSNVLELIIMKQLNNMYGENGSSVCSYQTLVHYFSDIWDKIMVENPMKEHTKKFNSTLRSLNESDSPNHYKRRKFSRECRLRNNIDSTNDELSMIEDSLRKRKSRRKSHDQYSPISDLVNQSTILCQDINTEKLETSQRLMLDSTLNPNAEAFYPRKRSLPHGELNMKKKLMDETFPSSLEDSVINCLKSIDDTRVALRKSQEYWKQLLNG